MWSFQGTVQRRLWLRGLEASGEGWQQIGALTADGAQWGYAAGVSRAGVPWTWACRADSATVQWGGRRREVGTGPQGRRAAAGALGWGPGKSSGAPHPKGTAGGPRSRRRAILVCLAGEAAGSVEPHTRAHTPREHAQCGLGNFLPSRGPPWPPPGPQLAKLGATGRANWGRGARLSPLGVGSPASPLLGPRLISRQPLPRLGTEACMSSTAPRGQVRGRLARGLAVWPPAGWTR